MTERLSLNKLDANKAEFQSQLAKLLRRDNSSGDDQVEKVVSEIINRVRTEGDAALFSYTRQFDNFDLTQFTIEISQQRLQQALDGLDRQDRLALEFADQRIRHFHQQQLEHSWQLEEADGTVLGQKVSPIDCVGLYVPGGKASYPSSVLMNAIPAKVAGVSELTVVSPSPNGELNEMVLAAAALAGVDQFLRIGGAQAVAALAYGTESVAAVDKITGPGNAYVACAKKRVFGQVGIDMIAGPSEVLVIADSSVDSDWVAMDMFAQAEHDEKAQAILLTKDSEFADKVTVSMDRLLTDMPRAEIIQQSLAANGAIIVAETDQQLVDIANQIAPEHLQIFVANADSLAEKIRHAGAMFIGPFSAESMGDYCAGPNHVLPTSGTARFSSPLGVYDFQKRTSIIKISQQGAQTIGKQASLLAESESLTAHARSAAMRLDSEA